MGKCEVQPLLQKCGEMADKAKNATVLPVYDTDLISPQLQKHDLKMSQDISSTWSLAALNLKAKGVPQDCLFFRQTIPCIL